MHPNDMDVFADNMRLAGILMASLGLLTFWFYSVFNNPLDNYIEERIDYMAQEFQTRNIYPDWNWSLIIKCSIMFIWLYSQSSVLPGFQLIHAIMGIFVLPRSIGFLWTLICMVILVEVHRAAKKALEQE